MRNNLSLYTIKERIFLVKNFYSNANDVKCVKSRYFLEYGVLDNVPTDSLIFEIINLFEKTGSVKDFSEFEFTKVENPPVTFVEYNDPFLTYIKVEKDEEETTEQPTFDTKGSGIFLPDSIETEDVTKDVNSVKPAEKKRRSRKPPHVKIQIQPSDYTEVDGQLACKKCNQKYSTKKGLRLHLSRHLQQDPVTCMYCPESFLTTIQYRNHLREKHDEEVKIAVKKVKDKPSDKPLKPAKPERPLISCEFCPKTFTLGSVYRKHLVSHSDKRDYVCDTCGKAFKKLCPLTRHMKIHTGERPYKCTFPNCDRTYRDLNSLKLHGLCHTDEKPFSCEQCGKCFRDRSYLKVHYRSHTGENPFKCELCGKETKQRQNLKSHMRHFHKINNAKL